MLKYKKQFYEYFMLVLALFSVSLIWLDLGVFNYMIFLVWAVFFIDITVRIYYSRSKFIYILKNPLDIVSVIPLDSFFLLARFSSFFTVLRSRSILTRYTLRLREWLITVSFSKVTVGFFLLVILLNTTVMLLRGTSVLETIRWSFLSMYVFDYAKETDNLSILIITIALKLSYLLYVGYLVNLMFSFLLLIETDLRRIYYRFRNKEDRQFYRELSLTSSRHREENGYNQKVNEQIMEQLEQAVHKKDLQMAAVKNANRGLRNVYIKLIIIYQPHTSEDGNLRLEPSFNLGVRGLEYTMETADSLLILSPEELTSTDGFEKMLRKFPFLDLHLTVFNAPDFPKGNFSWIEIRCYWEKYL